MQDFEMFEHELELFGQQEKKMPQLDSMGFINRNDEIWNEAAENYRLAKFQLKKFEATEKQLRNQLIEMTKGVNTLGCGIKVEKNSRKGNVDYTLIQELKNLDLDQYRKPSFDVWRIS
jgi:hypothetical protein